MTSLVLPLRFSPSLIAALIAVHVLPCAAVFGSGVPNEIRMIVAMLVCTSFVFLCWRSKYWAHRRIELAREGDVFLLYDEDKHELDLLPGCTDLSYLIVLHWREKESNKVSRCALTKDGLGADAWREFRIWLRWHSGLLQH